MTQVTGTLLEEAVLGLQWGESSPTKGVGGTVGTGVVGTKHRPAQSAGATRLGFISKEMSMQLNVF